MYIIQCFQYNCKLQCEKFMLVNNHTALMCFQNSFIFSFRFTHIGKLFKSKRLDVEGLCMILFP